MSTEKLSELSNNARKAVNSFYNWSQLASCTSERVSCLTVEQLKETSELLSALLAELEAKDEQNKLLMREIEHGKKLRVNMQNNADSLSERIAELEEDRRQLNLIINSEANRADAAEKRVAELSELETQVKVWESAATKHLARAEEAEKRLATPVRLPTQEKYDDPLSAHLAINDSAEAIRAAGFKVMGDEQC
ncbi:hypothetical protein [Serratia ureilytica]|uniref:hypothetical protein n=1 Tax=Serratia ureilytica TaxID=300181 RepID=UPI0018D8CC4C|nr:hypothetical protein [Serratia ureilytica]MBH3006800.1 hypothetical protein [Serratia ureilytica]